MKFAILFILIVLVSCSKSNMLVKHTWKIKYYRDTTAIQNSPVQCPGDRTWISDTVVSYNAGEPEGAYAQLENRPPKFIQYLLWNDQFIRTYFIYTEQIN